MIRSFMIQVQLTDGTIWTFRKKGTEDQVRSAIDSMFKEPLIEAIGWSALQ